MKIQDFINQYSRTGGPKVDGGYNPNIVLYAGEYLEREGKVFALDFNVADAVDKAARSLTDKYDDDEDETRVWT